MPNRKKLQQLGTDGGINPESLARNDGAGRLRNVIQKLPPQYRIVLVLRDMEEFSDEQVAAITGLRSGTMRVRLHRARLLLRNELMKEVKPRGGKPAAVSRSAAVLPKPPPAVRPCSPNSRVSRRPVGRFAFKSSETAPERLPVLPGLPGESQGNRRAMPKITRGKTEPQTNRQTAHESPGGLRTHSRKKSPPLAEGARPSSAWAGVLSGRIHGHADGAPSISRLLRNGWGTKITGPRWPTLRNFDSEEQRSMLSGRLAHPIIETF